MVLFALFFTCGVWWLQQQAALPDMAWAGLLWCVPLLWWLTRRTLPHPLLHHIAQALWLLCAVGLGFFYAAWLAENRLADALPSEWQGREIEVVGVVSTLPRPTEQGQSFMLDVERSLTPQVHVPKRILLSTYPDRNADAPEVHAGERWQLTVRLKRPHGSRNPHGFDFEAWAFENRIRAVGYVYNKGINQLVDVLASGYQLAAWREDLAERIHAVLGTSPHVGVLVALAIGIFVGPAQSASRKTPRAAASIT